MRFNTYDTDGHEKAMGSKTTDWLATGTVFMRREDGWPNERWPKSVERLEALDDFKRVMFRVAYDQIEYLQLYLCRKLGSSGCGQYIEGKSPKFQMPRLPNSLHYVCSLEHDLIPKERWVDVNGPMLEMVRPRLKGKTPTTGILGLIIALEHDARPRPIKLVGFGPRNEFCNGHYYVDAWNRIFEHKPVGGPHDFDAEREIINEWEKEGLVERCDA
jgi:hypothetical protein